MTNLPLPAFLASLCIALWLALSSPQSIAQENPAPPPHRGELLLIIGSPGEADYKSRFETAAESWQSLAAKANIALTRVDDSSSPSPKEAIESWILSRHNNSDTPLWIVYIGHGTHSRARTELNLLGPDPTVDDFKSWLAPISAPLVFIHGGSASGPFIPALSAPNRILITATKSGAEQNYARFGELFADRLGDRQSDLDLDGQISLLEAFVTTSSAVETFYRESGRLASEHALLDDNGDARALTASAFQGLRLKNPSLDSDGAFARRTAFLPAHDQPILTASERAERDRLEAELESLKSQKDNLSEEDYYRQLDLLFQQLSQFYLEAPADS